LPELRKRGAILHFKRRDWQICDSEVMGRRSVAAPLKPGGLLFFDGMLPHGTPENRTQARRRAVQFHYVAAGVKRTTEEERLRIFGSEGKNVTC
jgi:phytanoyl-CoA hydroxylase